MMRLYLIYIFLVLFSFGILSGCGQKKIATTREFNIYLSNADNGFKIARSVNGVSVTVMYTPPEYVALKEMEAAGTTSQRIYDSTLAEKKLSSTFLMIFGPDEANDNKVDIMYKDLKDFKGYVERSMTLNFDMEEKVELKTENGSYRASLSSLENTYGLTKDRKIDFVFLPIKNKQELKDTKKFDFVYSDESFDVGILHFEFDKAKLESKLPEISFGH